MAIFFGLIIGGFLIGLGIECGLKAIAEALKDK